MEYSSHYKRRQELLRKGEIPFLSEIASEWGKQYSDMFCANCEESLKYFIGIKPTLGGAGNELWISPSDMLAGKVRLKPPPSSKHMRALTHAGVLEIGRSIEEKYSKERELEKNRALKEHESMRRYDFNQELKKTLSELIAREREHCEAALDEMRQEFEMKLEEELSEMQIRMRLETDLLYEEITKDISQQWQLRLEEVVGIVVENLTKDFLEQMERHIGELEYCYINLLKKERIKTQFSIHMERIQNCSTMKHLRHNLECSNLRNMIYVICMEKRKCQREMSVSEKQYKQVLSNLRSVAVSGDVEMAELTSKRDEKQLQLKIRDQCIMEIIRQYRRLVGFALRSCPEAELLVHVEQLLNRELSYTSSEESEYTSEINSRKSSYVKIPSTIKSSTQILYDENTYLREDFQNVNYTSLLYPTDSKIWNKDVEHLMQILEQRVSSKVLEESPKINKTRSCRSIRSSRFSSVHFTRTLNKRPDSTATLLHTVSQQDISPKRSNIPKPSIRYSYDRLQGVDLTKLGEVERTKSILSTVNSLELISVKHQADDEDEVIVRELTEEVLKLKGKRKKSEPEAILRLCRPSISSGKSVVKAVVEPVISSSHTVVHIPETKELQNVIDFSSKLNVTEDSLTLIKQRQPSQFSLKKSKDDAFISSYVSPDSKLSLAADSLQLLQERMSFKKDTGTLSKKSSRVSIVRKDSLELARDSLRCIMKRSAKEAPSRAISREASKLSVLRDSLELFKQTQLKKRSQSERESLEMVRSQMAKDPSFVIKLEDEGDRAVKLSHIEVIKIEKQKDEDVQAETSDVEEFLPTDSVQKVYAYGESADQKRPVAKKKRSGAKAPRAEDEVKKLDDGAEKPRLHNIESIMEVLKSSSGLMRMFTPCIR